MANNSLEVTKNGSHSEGNGHGYDLVEILQPDGSGRIRASLAGGVDVDINVRSGQVTVQSVGEIHVTRSYDVGHPVYSGLITELQLRPLVYVENHQEVKRVSFNLDTFKAPFPDRRSHLTIRGGSRESVTLY